MSATVANVPLSLNLVTLMVDLYSSVSSDRSGTGLSNLCVGTAKKAHEPVKINQVYRCPTCSNEDKTTFVKGYKQGKGLVVVDPDTVDKALGEANTVRGMEFTYHKASEVETQTVPIDAPYYVGIQGPHTSQPAQVYALLARWIEDNPDVALLTRYAPRSAVATYRLTSRNGVLMLQKLCFPHDMHAAPAVPKAEDNPALLSQLDMMIRTQVDSFDPAVWTNRRRELLDAYAAEQAGEVVFPATGEPTAAIVDIAELIRRSTSKAKRPSKARKPVSKSA